MRILNLKLFITFLLVSFAGGIPAAAQDSSKVEETTFAEVRKEARELASTLKRYGADQREESVDTATKALFELDNRILDLQLRIDNRWDEMNQAARDEARESLRALQRQRIELAEWYGGLKSDSGDAWKDIRQGFSQAFGEINEGWEKALREFSDKAENSG